MKLLMRPALDPETGREYLVPITAFDGDFWYTLPGISITCVGCMKVWRGRVGLFTDGLVCDECLGLRLGCFATTQGRA